MPQLLAIAAIGGLVFYAWRALKREMAKVGDELDKQEKMRSTRDATLLEPDENGVYRPKKIDDGKN